MRPAVLFDLDDTLLDFHKAEASAIRRTLTAVGAPATDEIAARYSAINDAHWKRLEKGELTRVQVLTGRFAQLFSELGVDFSPEDAWHIYEKNLSEGHWFIEGAEELLQTLSPRYTLCLVSNGTASVQDKRIESAGIARYFEKIFISQRVGINKPAAAFFDHCFAALPCLDRTRTIIVGDSLTSDILGGRNAGIATCWFNPRRLPPRADIPADHEIVALCELPPLLEHIFGEQKQGTSF